MTIISLKELSAMEDDSILKHWHSELERANRAFLIMGKLTYITSLRLEGKALRQWKAARNLSKGSSVRANTTSRFIELFVATERVSEERFDKITWQVIETVKKLTIDWKGTPRLEQLEYLAQLIVGETDNVSLLKKLKVLVGAKKVKDSGANSVQNIQLTARNLYEFKIMKPHAYPTAKRVLATVKENQAELKKNRCDTNNSCSN